MSRQLRVWKEKGKKRLMLNKWMRFRYQHQLPRNLFWPIRDRQFKTDPQAWSGHQEHGENSLRAGQLIGPDSQARMQNEMGKSKRNQHGAATVTQTCRPSAPPPALNLMVWYLPSSRTIVPTQVRINTTFSQCVWLSSEEKNGQCRKKTEGEREKRWSREVWFDSMI